MSSTVIPSSWRVPARFRQRLGRRAGRQRAMSADDHLLLILHACPRPAPAPTDPRLFLRQPDGSWASHPSKTGGKPVVQHLEEYEQALEAIEKRLSKANDSGDFFRVLREIGPIARSSRNQRLALQEAREASPGDTDVISYRDQAEDIERLAELIQNEAKHGLDFALARRAEEQALSSHRMATSSYRLNLLVALFFPIATMSSIFGMNLHHGLEPLDTSSAPLPLLGILGAGLMIGLILTAFISSSPEPLEIQAPRRKG